jgi:hypothetical protein
MWDLFREIIFFEIVAFSGQFAGRIRDQQRVMVQFGLLCSWNCEDGQRRVRGGRVDGTMNTGKRG